MKKKLWIFFIIITLQAIFYFYFFKQEGQEYSSSKTLTKNNLIITVKIDLQALSFKKELPSEWYSIKEVKQITSDVRISNWIPEKIIESYLAQKNGHFRLEYALLPELPNEQSTRVLIQFGLYDLQTNNKIWEKIRIYEQ